MLNARILNKHTIFKKFLDGLQEFSRLIHWSKHNTTIEHFVLPCVFSNLFDKNNQTALENHPRARNWGEDFAPVTAAGSACSKQNFPILAQLWG